MRSVTLDGIEYVKATVAAKEYGYTNDYIGQLCRAGKIEAHLVGRTWYVLPEALQQHKKSRYRSNQKKTLETVRSDVQAAVAHQQKMSAEMQSKIYVGVKNIDYGKDDQALIPQVRKVKVSESDTSEGTHLAKRGLTIDTTEPDELEVEVAQPRKTGVLTITEDTSDASEFSQQSNPVVSLAKSNKKTVLKTMPVEVHATKDRNSALKLKTTVPDKKSQPSDLSPVFHFVGPVAISMFAGLALASLLVGLSWRHTETNDGVTEQTYAVNMSTAIQAFFGL